MTRLDDEDDDDQFNEADDDPNAPDDVDIDDSDDDTDPCPYCGKSIHHQAEICPHCGSYISAEDAPRRRPWWIWVGVVLCLIGVLLWIF